MQSSRVPENIADIAGGAAILTSLSSTAPTILVILGIAWFALRFIDFVRVVVFKKDSWMKKVGN